ncbi:MAG: DUF2195 family protein [Gammaproteobacteria bacterium]|nr:DUF2195 family protein [Gammaproteobacteria bacterium]MBU1553681.1 DUF2195 family protein [Gammaproteobacteria bacterium]MBU2071399.1 DUF2195 family protein [Gammaproteobacteria bacterium]MBU2182411.1 DUF2195 family protein [Gammaproteobacteria bacterium]MBU2204149.1 DUF2195 family protein [Gammaproteobacteria bacterium]
MFASSLMLMLLPAIAFDSAAVAIENGLQQCVQINKSDIVQRNNITLLDADISVLQAIGYCGCKSAVASYHLYNKEQHLRSEAITLKSSNTYSFVLAVDDKAPISESLRLQLSCAGD